MALQISVARIKVVSIFLCLVSILTVDALHLNITYGSRGLRSRHSDGAHQYARVNSTLPTLFFVGASKCATSSIAVALRRHPHIINIADGESHLYDKDPFSAKETYEYLVDATRAAKATVIGPHGSATIMEYTPHYLFEVKAPQRICQTLAMGHQSCKKARFIVFIREPVARTLSSWEFKRINEGDDRSLKTVVKEGGEFADAILQCWKKHGAANAVKECNMNDLLTPSPHDYTSRICRSHVGKSLYFYQLSNWFAHIPKQCFLVMQFETYYSNPSKYLSKILKFIGVDSFGKHGFKSAATLKAAAEVRVNSMHDAKLHSQITDGIKKELATIFKPHNVLLDELLGVKTGY